MTQTSNRFFDEIGRLMNDAAGAAQGVKREVDTVVRNQAERILRDLDLVKREEFDAVKDMARLAREENEALKTRIAALEAKARHFAVGAGCWQPEGGRVGHHSSWLGLSRPSTFSVAAARTWMPGPRPGMTAKGVIAAKTGRKIPSFPCHFAPLGLKARHVRSPRTPGGLLWDANGPRCGL